MQIPSHRLVPLALGLAACLACGGAFAQLKLPGTAAPAGSGLNLGKPEGGPPPAAAPSAKAEAKTDTPAAAKPPKDTEAMEQAATTAAMGWLLLLDRKDWGTAWETSARMFRGAVPLAKWMDGIPKARQPLGTLIERTPVAAVYKPQLPGRPAGDYVTVVFKSRYDKKPEVEELVTTVREPDGKWRATGYVIR